MTSISRFRGRGSELNATLFRRQTLTSNESHLIAESMSTESGTDVIMKAAVPPDMFESDWQLYLAFNYDWMTKEDSKIFFREYLGDASEFTGKWGSHEKMTATSSSAKRVLRFQMRNAVSQTFPSGMVGFIST